MKGLFKVLAVGILSVSVLTACEAAEEVKPVEEGKGTTQQEKAPSEAPKASEKVVEDKEAKEEPKKPKMTTSQSNAIRQAENYINTMPFSKTGLAEQLEYEGYSAADAKFAVDQLEVDWRGQAVRHAKQYMETMPFSRDGLIEQLVYEGHSKEDAVYAAGEVGL